MRVHRLSLCPNNQQTTQLRHQSIRNHMLIRQLLLPVLTKHLDHGYSNSTQHAFLK